MRMTAIAVLGLVAPAVARTAGAASVGVVALQRQPAPGQPAGGLCGGDFGL